MTTIATVYVEYDPGTQVVTLSGGNDPANDGTVDVEYGAGNTITFEAKDQDVRVWTMDQVVLTKQGEENDPSRFSQTSTPSQIVLTDNNGVPAGQSAVIYTYVVHVHDQAAKMKVRSLDPKIVNKPNTEMRKQMRSGSA